MLVQPELTVKLVDVIMAAPVFPPFRIRYDPENLLLQSRQLPVEKRDQFSFWI